MNQPFAITLVSSLDPTLRDIAVGCLLADQPNVVVVRHELNPGRPDEFRRLVLDRDGVLDDSWCHEWGCPTCNTKDDAIRTLQRLIAAGNHGAAAIVLPLSQEPAPVARALMHAIDSGTLPGGFLASAATVLDLPTFADDLLGDFLLAESNRHISEADRRSVGEALAPQVAYADFVLTSSKTDATGGALLDHIRGRGSHRVDQFTSQNLSRLFQHLHHFPLASSRVDPRLAAANGAPAEAGVWTLELTSPAGVHPDRLLDRIQQLGAKGVRGRGCFWTPHDPDIACVWDGAGGQVSIGICGDWTDATPSTRLVFTGIGETDQRIRQAFADILLTPEESGQDWTQVPNALAAWLN